MAIAIHTTYVYYYFASEEQTKKTEATEKVYAFIIPGTLFIKVAIIIQ